MGTSIGELLIITPYSELLWGYSFEAQIVSVQISEDGNYVGVLLPKKVILMSVDGRVLWQSPTLISSLLFNVKGDFLTLSFSEENIIVFTSEGQAIYLNIENGNINNVSEEFSHYSFNDLAYDESKSNIILGTHYGISIDNLYGQCSAAEFYKEPVLHVAAKHGYVAAVGEDGSVALLRTYEPSFYGSECDYAVYWSRSLQVTDLKGVKFNDGNMIKSLILISDSQLFLMNKGGIIVGALKINGGISDAA